MITEMVVELGIWLFLGAALYAAVGHGGASVYLALMGLWGMTALEMKPIALVLNVFVAGIALVAFLRAGHFSGKLFWPLVVASVPMAFVGGAMKLDAVFAKWILAGALVVAGWRLLFEGREKKASGEVGMALRKCYMASKKVGMALRKSFVPSEKVRDGYGDVFMMKSESASAFWVLVLLGAGIGWVSGMVGIGGGIFLTPILILLRWSGAKG